MIVGRTKEERIEHQHRWRRKFAIIPREVADGVWVWLCMVEFRDVAWPPKLAAEINKFRYIPRYAYRIVGTDGPGFPDYSASDEKRMRMRPPPGAHFQEFPKSTINKQ
jgi:hypothetical protein